MKKLIILASGSGTNAENIIRYFEHDAAVSVACVLSNKSNAGVLNRCDQLQIPAFYFNKSACKSDKVLNFIKCENPDLIILAGFLWKIPLEWVHIFPEKIVNVHPALLPKFGGKGMYGNHVHQAVKESGDSETGITIHLVNEEYDKGSILFQASTKVYVDDTVDGIAAKVHELEYKHYPEVIHKLLQDG